MNDVKFGIATRDRVGAICALLAESGLSTDGMELLIDNCIVAEAGSRLVGTIALEPYGQWALLRSLAVAPDYRARSLGGDLCARVASLAHLLGVEQLYLLATDAEQFFSRLGFKRIERDQAPPAIQNTTEFRTLCPKNAVCMVRDIRHEAVHSSAELLRLRPDVPGARMWAVSLQHTMLTYFEVDPHSRFESHSHESEQITMVLTGELFFEVRGAIHSVKPGEVIAIPSSVPHAVWTEALRVTAIDAWSPVMTQYGEKKTD